MSPDEALVDACSRGDVDGVTRAITRGADNWNMGMEYACYGGHMDIVLLMIRRGADAWNQGMAHACLNGHQDLVLLMIQKGANAWDAGMTNACYGGHMDMVDLMITRGASRWDWGMVSACTGGHVATAFEMLRRGAANTQKCLELIYRRDEFAEFIAEYLRRDKRGVLPWDTPRNTVVQLLWRGVARIRVNGAACAREVFRELDAVNAAIVIPQLPEVLEREVRSYFP